MSLMIVEPIAGNGKGRACAGLARHALTLRSRPKLAPPGGDPPGGSADQVGDSEMRKLRPELRKREKLIRKGQQSWRVQATALMEIRDLRLYRAEGHSDFGRYCREKLHIGKSTTNRQIAIAEVYKAVASTGAKLLPTTERQMRPLLKLRNPSPESTAWRETVARVWSKVVEDCEILKERITGKRVARTLEELGLQEPKPKNRSILDFDREKRWADLLAYLDHEREFWPSEHRQYLSEHIVALVRHWGTKPVLCSTGTKGNLPPQVVEPKMPRSTSRTECTSAAP